MSFRFLDASSSHFKLRLALGVQESCMSVEDVYLLISLAYQSAMLVASCADVCNRSILRVIIFLVIDVKAQALALLDYSIAETGTFLSDAASKYQSINFTAKLHVVAADKVKYAIHEQVYAKLAFGVIRCRDFAKVRRASQSLEATFLI